MREANVRNGLLGGFPQQTPAEAKRERRFAHGSFTCGSRRGRQQLPMRCCDVRRTDGKSTRGGLGGIHVHLVYSRDQSDNQNVRGTWQDCRHGLMPTGTASLASLNDGSSNRIDDERRWRTTVMKKHDKTREEQIQEWLATPWKVSKKRNRCAVSQSGGIPHCGLGGS